MPNSKNPEEMVDKMEDAPENWTEEDADQDNEEITSSAEKENSGPRFDEIDVMFYMFLAIVGDVADSVWVPRLFLAPTTILFLYIKGIDSTISKNVIAQAVELVPGVGWLPISTTAALFTVLATNYPEKFEKWFGRAGKVIEKAGKMGKK